MTESPLNGVEYIRVVGELGRLLVVTSRSVVVNNTGEADVDVVVVDFVGMDEPLDMDAVVASGAVDAVVADCVVYGVNAVGVRVLAVNFGVDEGKNLFVVFVVVGEQAGEGSQTQLPPLFLQIGAPMS